MADTPGGFKVGVGTADVTGPILPVGMMGFGMTHQRVEGVAMPLSARAFALDSSETGQRLVFVSAELWGITQGVHRGVMERLANEHGALGLGEHNVMLTATHTHSGPGGYAHHLLFNLSISGYASTIYEAIVEGLVEAIVKAVGAMRPGRISLQVGEIPPEEPVGFNRAMKAYNTNHDVEPRPESEAHLAINREMTTLRFDDAEGEPLGAINWFGVHACNLHADNRQVHPDNKGYASAAFEAHAAEVLGAPGFQAAFPQTGAGDVTPNYRWDSARGLSVGAMDDDFASARHNGDIQYRQALRLFEACAAHDSLSECAHAVFRYVDYTAAPVSDDFGRGVQGARTGSATIGIGMAMGTEDGPGPLFRVRLVPWLLSRLCALYHGLRALVLGRARVAATTPHGNKFPMLEVGRGRHGRILGLFRQDRAPVPDAADPTVARLKQLARRGALGDKPWAPTILPLQLFRLGELAIVALPFEPTTVAVRRMASVVQGVLGPAGVRHVVISGYANAYCGYLTTREEYQVQAYEGASNYMGQWTLAATMTQLREMAEELVTGAALAPGGADEGPRPMRFEEAELALRAFEPSTP